MRVVCAPDSFKGSLGAHSVAASVRAGILAVASDLSVVLHPLSDGGEGTLEVLAEHGFDRQPRTIHDQHGAAIEASFGLRGSTAVIESASACGFDKAATPAHALSASSFGVGELISHALDAGAREILLTLGGTSTTDGGAGMAEALGYRFLDSAGNSISRGGDGLRDLASVDTTGRDIRLDDVSIRVLTDVDNPLLGNRGAAAVFSPQKGADQDAVHQLEKGLSTLVRVTKSTHADSPGAGAGGGLGFGALEFLGATSQSGATAMMELTGFDEVLSGADLVITGEGSFDDQSLRGKVPFEVIKAAHSRGIPVWVVCGVNGMSSKSALEEWGIRHVSALSEREPDREKSIAHAAELLQKVGAEIGRSLLGY